MELFVPKVKLQSHQYRIAQRLMVENFDECIWLVICQSFVNGSFIQVSPIKLLHYMVP